VKRNLYTDGACWPTNPGPGAAVSVCVENRSLDTTRTLPRTTVPRAELHAVVDGLNALPAAQHVDVHTDAMYVVYAHRRVVSGDHRSFSNPDLLQALADAEARHAHVTVTHVKGHSGNPWNEVAHTLAEQAARDAGRVATRTDRFWNDRTEPSALDRDWLDAAERDGPGA